MPLSRKVAALRDPATYPDRPERIDVVQTHMAWVFLTNDRAFKLKKPVDTRFLDFSTPAARRRDGEREVALNRPLAGETYRGVLPLVLGEKGGLRLGGPGPPVDWLVVMRRLSAGDSLAARIAARAVDRREVQRAIEWLTRFYARLEPEWMSGHGYRARLASQIRDSEHELLRASFELPRERVRRLARRQLDVLARDAEDFDRRARRGFIIDAHGDLRPEHIFLRPLPTIIDCLEFSRDLRLLDPLSELAFLSLECERLGAPWIGAVALAQYRAQTGDDAPSHVVALYRAGHALSRAVIALWHLDDPGRKDGEHFRQKALTYLDLAERVSPRGAR